MKKIAILAAFAALSMAAPAAAKSPIEMAKAHFDAIAGANVGRTMTDYADKATLRWIGGPLDGVYAGKSKIFGVWKKFTGAQGALKLSVANIRSAANPAGTTVTADVVFTGKKAIPVRYVLVYRGGKLVAETWQIAAKKSGY